MDEENTELALETTKLLNLLLGDPVLCQTRAKEIENLFKTLELLNTPVLSI